MLAYPTHYLVDKTRPTAFASCFIFNVAPQIAPEIITVANSPVIVYLFHAGQDATIDVGAFAAGAAAGGLEDLGGRVFAPPVAAAFREGESRGFAVGGGMLDVFVCVCVTCPWWLFNPSTASRESRPLVWTPSVAPSHSVSVVRVDCGARRCCTSTGPGMPIWKSRGC
jgi:hypothetical protein